MYLPNTLHRVEKLFKEHNTIGLLHGNSTLFGMNKQEKTIKAPTTDLQAKYLAYIPYPQPSSFFKRSILNNIGLLNENLHYGMDYDLLVRIALNYDILQTNDLFSKYRLHSESKTKQGLNFAKEWSIVFSKLLRSIPKTEDAKKALQILNLFDSANDKFEVTKQPENIELSLLYFLNTQLHYYYEALELKKTIQIASLIKELDKEFYRKEKIRQIFSKSNYLHPSVINLLRNFTRK